MKTLSIFFVAVLLVFSNNFVFDKESSKRYFDLDKLQSVVLLANEIESLNYNEAIYFGVDSSNVIFHLDKNEEFCDCDEILFNYYSSSLKKSLEMLKRKIRQNSVKKIEISKNKDNYRVIIYR